MCHKTGTCVRVMKNGYIFGIENKGITAFFESANPPTSAFLYRGAGEL